MAMRCDARAAAPRFGGGTNRYGDPTNPPYPSDSATLREICPPPQSGPRSETEINKARTGIFFGLVRDAAVVEVDGMGWDEMGWGGMRWGGVCSGPFFFFAM